MALNRAILFPIRSFPTRRMTPILMTSSQHFNANYTNIRYYKTGLNWRDKSYLAGGILLTGYLLYKQCYYTSVLCDTGDVLDSHGERSDKVLQKTDAFKKRYTMSYENRIRMYSLPDKIFRYFC